LRRELARRAQAHLPENFVFAPIAAQAPLNIGEQDDDEEDDDMDNLDADDE
jgi:hypothetical protein